MTSLAINALNNTLSAYLHSIVGKSVSVELRNESSVSGRLSGVDGFMNLDLTNAVYVTPNGTTQNFEDFQVRGRQVRFVQLPPCANPEDDLKKYFDEQNRKRLLSKVASLQSSGNSRLLKETRLMRDELKREFSKKN
ncbi:unnamed protein product [Notodromas monacha]|uniref:Sm domain-containing protein n=1 Tax=Notodromas monacha TaxID=399045 RepID=A0A7R9GDV3_9CRUS|nr:unnamed protein product [Notodromas monacha]CAG0917357.1 unnamed protein product [Notodromas monacha]